jgi:Cd2+/Zn2+-exporting ATPase
MRPEAREAIDAVRARGVREIRLVSGDAEPATMMVATRSGIAEADVRAALMPDGKVEAIRALGAIPGVRAVAMVGDGINDAMALAVADVGIAMGSGSAAIARDVADVTIVADDLRRVAWFLALASRTRRIISANVAMALGIKLAVLVLATAGFANLWLAIAADTGATVLVALNGSRLLGQAVGGDRRPITPVESTST